ncbi:cyanophycin synthetase, partial [Streptococcus sp. DD11]|uniref:glutamate ligase domain-containing protein n=1 Tax=Streptococcus sp. DD11 TaxID=1777879 RepID=UPI0024085766
AEAHYRTALLGLHQIDNAALAIELCDTYCRLKGLPLLSQTEVDEALLRAVWPGRLEKLSERPLILIDGAHNPHAMRSLLASLSEHYPAQKKQLLFACIQTKSLEEMVGLLQTVPAAELTLTAFADKRSFSREAMEELAEKEGLSYRDWPDYLEHYLAAEHEADELLLLTGSLYFLAQVRPYIIKN